MLSATQPTSNDEEAIGFRELRGRTLEPSVGSERAIVSVETGQPDMNTKRRRVYIDTSVVGGCLDPEWETPSIRFFSQVRDGLLLAVVSDLTLAELEGAPMEVRAVLETLPKTHLEFVSTTWEALQLADGGGSV